ncbi:MAG: transposase [Caulobacter sp.]|nr:transposase [Caulobacter sp.]
MEITTIGLDLAKNVFQVHAIDAAGSVVVRKALRRAQVLPFFGKLQPCLMRLMPPAYVKPYVKRGKTDANNAGAICETVTRPTMRFASIKSEQQQAALALHRTRDLLVKQRTQLANMIRGLLKLTLYNLAKVMEGDALDDVINPLIVEDQAERLATLEEGYT